MTLFDASPYGTETPRRARKSRPDEIRLEPPWVLIRSHSAPPTAHLLADIFKPNERDLLAARNGAVRTVCDHYGMPMTVDGHPMAKLCHSCWDHVDRRATTQRSASDPAP